MSFHTGGAKHAVPYRRFGVNEPGDAWPGDAGVKSPEEATRHMLSADNM
jgi:hypothetical protein